VAVVWNTFTGATDLSAVKLPRPLRRKPAMVTTPLFQAVSRQIARNG
jgi:hypothetical protein